jgi:hypothetical protein
MAGENKTVLEMEQAGVDGKTTVYTITKKQAELALKKMGHGDKFMTGDPDPLKPTGKQETFLNGEHAKALQEQGGTLGKIARYATKYLRVEGSETTIALTKDDVKELKSHGVKLIEAKK